ncbi:hypothetical protein J7K93_07315, partial [bacterium]|nr:hypothetical protein [bacterium]
FAIAVVALYKNRKKKLFNFVAQFNTQLGSGDYTLIIDKNKKIKFIGRDWANILQIEHYSALGRDMNKILLPNTVKPVLEVVNELMDTKKRRKTVALRNKPEGFQNQYLVIMKFLRDLDFYAFAIIDKSDEEYIKKVRYWAVIAQDLAHGIKTVLASIDMDINNQCDLFQEKYNKDDADMLKYFNSIKGQLDRLKRMSDGFMRFVNFKKSELKPVDVNKKVSEILLNLHSSFSSFINIEWDLDKSNPKALIDERQFETALTNVFVNAVESIETEGTIRVCTRKVHAFSSSGKNNYEDGCVEIIIHDTGKGIAPVYLDKITQPYFTQKDSGTGLGLALVKRIIESHEGELRINSQPGIGTSVSMRFKSYNNGL